MIDPRLSKLPSRAPSAVLDALVLGDKPAPRATIHVGATVVRKCKVLRVGDGVVMVADADGDGAYDVHYIVSDRITHVVVHASSEDLHAISFGALRVRTGETITALEVRRRAAALADEIGVRVGSKIAVELRLDAALAHDEALLDLADLLSDLRGALLGITQDEEGIRSLSARASRIVLHLGTGPAIALHDGALLVTSVLEAGSLAVPSDLRARLERLL